MSTDKDNARKVIDRATEAVRDATEEVQTTSESIAGAIEAGRQPGSLLDQLSRLTRDAPLPSLMIAFLAGFIIAYRR
jgi:ABC-type transporter Mla maintaining outer membrane lipid asymmetry permease subunit MlaE